MLNIISIVNVQRSAEAHHECEIVR